MCLDIKSNARLYVAKKDIVCYKQLLSLTTKDNNTFLETKETVNALSEIASTFQYSPIK
jgi:hypothetical protein